MARGPVLWERVLDSDPLDEVIHLWAPRDSGKERRFDSRVPAEVDVGVQDARCALVPEARHNARGEESRTIRFVAVPLLGKEDDGEDVDENLGREVD